MDDDAKPRPQATQLEVARLAGVSQRTVSNVVSGRGQVSAELASRVREAIETLGYVPSHAARSLRSGRSGVLQLIVPELDVPYFAELGREMIKRASERGFSVMVQQTLGSDQREYEALNGPVGSFAEGTVLSAVGSAPAVWPSRQTRAPLVLIGETRRTGVLDHIGIDDSAASKAATQHLIAVGARRVGFIGAHTDGDLPMAQMRTAGFAAALREAGLSLDPQLVAATNAYHRKDGEEAMSRLLALERPPDAVFCATDLLALGALRSAHELGISVPDDLVVMGFDGLEEGQYSVPTLSTVAPDKAALAEMCIERLLTRVEAHRLGSHEPAPEDLTVPFSLVARESTRRIQQSA
ncbi:MAG: LacI family transcriptional regulator [Bifidobacteriaceae bacterium]|nr:LacI family transcriptional regulator [Bifidobacteriaceae bacterium]